MLGVDAYIPFLCEAYMTLLFTDVLPTRKIYDTLVDLEVSVFYGLPRDLYDQISKYYLQLTCNDPVVQVLDNVPFNVSVIAYIVSAI